MNKWQLFSMLKGCNIPEEDKVINLIKSMDVAELREGVIEFLIMAERYKN